eukprot:1541200-Pleurochrysis_carterae.AAC.3
MKSPLHELSSCMQGSAHSKSGKIGQGFAPKLAKFCSRRGGPEIRVHCSEGNYKEPDILSKTYISLPSTAIQRLSKVECAKGGEF